MVSIKEEISSLSLKNLYKLVNKTIFGTWNYLQIVGTILNCEEVAMD